MAKAIKNDPAREQTLSTPFFSQLLENLTLAWEKWAIAPLSPARKISRFRAYLVFLLIRYGGLRLGEAFSLDMARDLRTDTGMITVRGASARTVFLSVGAMRRIRFILAMREADRNDFLRLDPGFARRTFYSVAQEASLQKALGGPRAIRYARGLELLAMHMPLSQVQEYLGLKKASQISSFLRFARELSHDPKVDGGASITADVNSYMCMVNSLELDFMSARVELETFSGLRLYAMCPAEIFMKLEPQPGQALKSVVDPARIILVAPGAAVSAANSLTCLVESVYNGRVNLRLPTGDPLISCLDTPRFGAVPFQKGLELQACFNASAVELRLV